jgi:HEAT repeat protein
MRRHAALAALCLALLAGPAAGAGWSEQLGHSDPAVRAMAYRQLSQEPDAAAALEMMSAALAHEVDAEVRVVARDAMSRLELEEAALVATLEDSPSAIARAWAAYALGHSRSPEALTALLLGIEDGDESVRREVYDALGRLGDRAALPALSRAAVREPSAALRKRAERSAMMVASGRGRGLDVSTELALLEGGDAADRLRAAEALGRSGDWRAMAPLVQAAREGDPELQKAALLALGELGDHRAVPALIEIATEGVGQARYAAIGALAFLGDELATPALVALLDSDDPGARQLSLRALAYYGAPEAVEGAVRLLSDPVELVRVECLLAMERSRSEGRVEALVTAAADPSPFVRAEAARVLGTTGSADAAAPLVAMLEDKEALVQLSAAEALAALGASSALPALERLLEKARNDEQAAIYEAAIKRLGGDL